MGGRGATKINFKMYVWYHYSLHDLPAYGIFCGWCTHGKFSCPTCKATLQFIWLRKGGKYSSFDKHRQFLPADHPFRRDIKNFTKGVVVTESAPQMLTGAVLHAQIDALQVNDEVVLWDMAKNIPELRSLACGGFPILIISSFHTILMPCTLKRIGARLFL